MKTPNAQLGLMLITIAFLLSPQPARCAQGRAISLSVLERTLKDGSSKQALTLCGVTRLCGFIVDTNTRDIILVGKVDPSYPSLCVDDLVVALRYANMVYARREGNTRYYTPPGCSIDPDPDVIQQLRQVNYGRGSSDEDRKAALDAWEEIGRQPQNVRVMGIPFDTHFAKVMVDADYYMKRLVNGSVDLEVAGFNSIMSMRIDATNQAIASGSELTEADNSLNRFWFCPGQTTYQEEDGMVMLNVCRVKLLTEEEFVTERGEMKGFGRSSTLARQFAEGFTSEYQAIAEARPIYKELEALFRFTALAGLMRQNRATTKSRYNMSYLLSGYKLQNVPVSRRVTGQTRVVEITDRKETSSETIFSYIHLMSCGGVNMDVHPKKIAGMKSVSTDSVEQNYNESVLGNNSKSVRSPRRGTYKAGTRMTLKKSVLASRISRRSLYWDVSAID